MSDIDINPLTGDYDLKGISTPIQPFIFSVIPAKVSTSLTSTITINGSNFDQNSLFDLGPNITINSINVINPNTVKLTITTNSVATTNNEVKVFNGTSQNFNNPVFLETGNFTILIPGTPTTPWQNISGGAITGVGSLDFINGFQWNQSATFGTIPANTDGYVEMRVTDINNSFFMMGLNDNNIGSNRTEINYALYISTGVAIYESGGFATSTGGLNVNDLFRIERVGGTISYYQNGNHIYTSSTPNTNALFFDCSGLRNGKLGDIQIVF